MGLCIILGGPGGYAYAIDHQAIKSSKLVSFAPYGTSGDGLQKFDAIFGYTNPDCTKPIAIEQISIIRADGVVVYEAYPNNALQPHQTRIMQLSDSQYSIPIPPPTPGFPAGHTVRFYTVEISYSAKGNTLPLTGTAAVFQYSKSSPTDTNPALSKTRTNMINM